MSRTVLTDSMKNRPTAPHATKSFTRYEPSLNSPGTGRSRASTVQSSKSGYSTQISDEPVSPGKRPSKEYNDVFVKATEEEGDQLSPSLSRSQSLPERFDELPVEVASLIDRFVESLSAKIYSEPPTIDQLSELFQTFYARAGSIINVHISSLLSRINRDPSPAPSQGVVPGKNLTTRSSVDPFEGGGGSSQSQQMLTVSEVNEKKKARRMLEYKRILLEEAVEKNVCERVYDKVWRHKNTLDEVRDEKLRSKTAALALVGIGLRDLGIELDPLTPHTPEDVQESLGPARDELARMNDEHYPLGKLQHLTRAHKSIVETLSNIHTATSSADDILPTLIYTLITSPIEGINVISNLYFIQRFRNANKVYGEAAYCLTNLEAAVGFLENIDLSSLRKDLMPDGSVKSSSGPTSPGTEKDDPLTSPRKPSLGASPATTATSKSNVSAHSSTQGPARPVSVVSQPPLPLPSTRHGRSLSNLFQPPAKVIGAANDAVRNTAEEGLKNISTTLDNSFKFLFGRLKEQIKEENDGDVIVPKTLDEARQLVNRPVTPTEDSIISETSSFAEESIPTPLGHPKADDKLLTAIGGLKPGSIRERSVDSVRSTGSNSGKNVAFAAGSTPADPSLAQKLPAAAHPGTNPLDSVRNLGTSIGSAFGGGFRVIRDSVSPSPVAAERTRATAAAESSFPSTSPLAIPKSVAGETLHVEPPIQRFVEMKDAGDLAIRDVRDLLQDYQRLAQVLKGLSQG